MSYLLDTSALLAHWRRETGWERVQAAFEDSDAAIFVSAVSVAEFGRRLATLGTSPEQAAQTLDRYLDLVEVVAVDESVARHALGVSIATPERLPLADSLIAACAMSRGARLVHRDQHLSRIPGELVVQVDLASVTAEGGPATAPR